MHEPFFTTMYQEGTLVLCVLLILKWQMTNPPKTKRTYIGSFLVMILVLKDTRSNVPMHIHDYSIADDAIMLGHMAVLLLEISKDGVAVL